MCWQGALHLFWSHETAAAALLLNWQNFVYFDLKKCTRNSQFFPMRIFYGHNFIQVLHSLAMADLAQQKYILATAGCAWRYNWPNGVLSIFVMHSLHRWEGVPSPWAMPASDIQQWLNQPVVVRTWRPERLANPGDFKCAACQAEETSAPWWDSKGHPSDSIQTQPTLG